MLQGAESTGPDCTTGLQQKVLNSREQSQHSRTLTRGNMAGWYCLLGLLESYLCQIFETDSVLTQVWGSAGSNATRTGRMNWKTEPPSMHSTPVPRHPFLYLLLIPSFQKKEETNRPIFVHSEKKIKGLTRSLSVWWLHTYCSLMLALPLCLCSVQRKQITLQSHSVFVICWADYSFLANKAFTWMSSFVCCN